MTTILSPADLSELAFHTCHSLRPVPGHGPLIDALRQAGGPDFSARVSRGGWYRPGRIIDAQGRIIAEDALGWLESALNEADDEGVGLAEQLRQQDWQVTHEQGITHYLVAPRGKSPADYLQLEIEELQEVISHPLKARIDEGEPIDSVEHLLAPPHETDGLRTAVRPLGHPRYSFRRINDMAVQIRAIATQAGKPPAVLRFLDEWASSSAGQRRHFSDHWVLALSEHLDRYRQPRISATPFAAHPLPWRGEDDAQGTALAQHIYDYDRSAGYGFAWYFQMVSGRKVPRTLAGRVHADLQGDMAYLPERDARLVAGWMETPYSL